MKKARQTEKSVVVPRVVMSAIKDAIRKLEVTNCAFKVVLPNGQEEIHDPNGLLNAPRKYKRFNPDRPYGTLSNYYKPYVENMKTGDVAEIPFGIFKVKELRGAVTAWCGNMWGNGSITSSTNDENKTIEILRIK